TSFRLSFFIRPHHTTPPLFPYTTLFRSHASPFNNVLSSAIGGDFAMPVVTRVDIREPGSVQLVCSDGLTRHVTDAEIADHLRRRSEDHTSELQSRSELGCRLLLEKRKRR